LEKHWRKQFNAESTNVGLALDSTIVTWCKFGAPVILHAAEISGGLENQLEWALAKCNFHRAPNCYHLIRPMIARHVRPQIQNR